MKQTGSQDDQIFMQEAIRLAQLAADQGEIPVGAVIVRNGTILASAHNLREKNKIVTAHAELLAIEEACRKLGDWRLSDTTLYVTLEPCPMCAGTIVNARIPRVVYGVKDAEAGCCGSILNLNTYPFHHAFSITSGVCEEECRRVLQEFFVARRARMQQGTNHE